MTEPKLPRAIADFAEFLADDAIAIVVKQQLLPDDVENPVIFPPTYLKARSKSRGENDDKKKDQQQSVYNLDALSNGDNVCEIDSPQSDGNRTEPLFKSESLKHLVPQIVIDVNGTPVNMLDAGHRAGDAVVRLSSLAAKFHDAFERAANGDHSLLASLAPTSLLYGAWDSRSTQTKLQRIIKASIRAENVRPLTRSATFIPAVDYVAVGAVNEELNVGEGDNNPLSSEGMLHALATQTLGGIRLTDPKKLIRTIKINLVALRQLRAITDQGKTDSLKKYILGLALVAATSDPDLNLREGCNLRIVGDDHWALVRHRKDDEWIRVDRTRAITFAEESGKTFFQLMAGFTEEQASRLTKGEHPYDKKDHPNETFERDVAEEFLGLKDTNGNRSGAERDKVRKIGPITRATLDAYWKQRKKREKAGDPDKVYSLIRKVKAISGGTKLNADAEKLRTYLNENPADTDELKARNEKLIGILDGNDPAEAKVTALRAVLPSTENQLPDTANPAGSEAAQ